MEILTEKQIIDLSEARSKSFITWSLTELIEYSVGNCHRPAKREIAIMYDIAHVVVYKYSDRHPQLGKLNESLFLTFDTLLHHLRTEETIFFPIIGQAGKKPAHLGAIAKTIPENVYEMAEALRNAHKAIMKDFGVIRELTGYYATPDDGDFLLKYLFGKMKRLDREMCFHMHLENTILFPKAIDLANESNKQECLAYAFWRKRTERVKI